jgi:hypothetical protein
MNELIWRKSSYSGETQPDCVEVAETPRSIHVRDTAHRDQAHLTVSAGEWACFLAAVRSGEL